MPYRDPAKNREFQREYHRRKYASNRARAVEYLGGKCGRCGRTDDLEFHHKNPATKTVRIGRVWVYSWEKILAEVMKCALLCPACHMIEDGRIDEEDYDDYTDVTSVVRIGAQEYDDEVPF